MNKAEFEKHVKMICDVSLPLTERVSSIEWIQWGYDPKKNEVGSFGICTTQTQAYMFSAVYQNHNIHVAIYQRMSVTTQDQFNYDMTFHHYQKGVELE